MVDSLIPVAPGMETPLEMLEACHERLQAQLATLGRLAAWHQEHGSDRQAQQAATNVMRYFDLAAVNHHLDEEEDLLPALKARIDPARGDALQVLIESILADHQEMFAALRDRDADAIRAAVRADIDAAFNVLVGLLK